MRRLALLAALALILPACDSGSDDALGGTWDTQQTRDATYLTVSQSQTARDPNTPGTGGLVVTGAVSGTLRYFFGDPASEGYALDAPFSGGSDNASLALVLDGNSLRLLALGSGTVGRAFDLLSFTGATPFTSTAAYIDITSAVFREDGTNAQVTVAGRLTFATRMLTAGREILFSETVSDRSEAGVLQVTFADGGVYRQVNSDLTTLAGTWVQIDDDEVRIRTGNDTVTNTFSVSGSTLMLTETSDLLAQQGCDTECQAQASLLFGIAPGTLSGFRSEYERTFRRGTEDDDVARPSARPARAGLRLPTGWPLPAR